MIGVLGALGVGLGEGDVARRCGGDSEAVAGLEPWHLDVEDIWVGEVDEHVAAVGLLPGAITLDGLLMAIDLRYPEDVALELEEVVALDIDPDAIGCDLLDVPGAEPRADVAMVASASAQGQQHDCK